MRGQVSSNGFKVFNSFIVEHLSFIGLFTLTEFLLLSKKKTKNDFIR